MFLFKTIVIESKNIDNEEIAQIIKDSFDPSDIIGNKLTQLFDNPTASKFFEMEFFENKLAQMTMCRIIDNFLSYLKDILTEVVILKPEILKSKDTEKLEFILGFDNMADLISAIVEKKIEDLSYRSFTDITTYFEQKLGISPLIDGDSTFLKTKIKERNLIVHNRSVINKDFIKECKMEPSLLGTELSYKLRDFFTISSGIVKEVVLIDSKITTKFAIPVTTQEY